MPDCRGVSRSPIPRRPWLQALRGRIGQACERGEDIVLACSSLKHEYREYLERRDPECVRYVYLRGSEELIRRLEEREGHFMDPALLRSQFEALEPPEGAIQLDLTPAPDVIAVEIRRKLGR